MPLRGDALDDSDRLLVRVEIKVLFSHPVLVDQPVHLRDEAFEVLLAQLPFGLLDEADAFGVRLPALSSNYERVVQRVCNDHFLFREPRRAHLVWHGGGGSAGLAAAFMVLIF
jgi:hypothetical protein